MLPVDQFVSQSYDLTMKNGLMTRSPPTSKTNSKENHDWVGFHQIYVHQPPPQHTHTQAHHIHTCSGATLVHYRLRHIWSNTCTDSSCPWGINGVTDHCKSLKLQLNLNFTVQWVSTGLLVVLNNRDFKVIVHLCNVLSLKPTQRDARSTLWNHWLVKTKRATNGQHQV